jgi:DNA-binding response OmpR family regulator
MDPTTEPLAVSGAATSKVILVVEDDAATAELLMEVLLAQEPSYAVFVAADSASAFTLVRQITPHRLLLDYYLSETTGLTLYDQLHAMRELEAVPAIILSASVQRHTAAIESRKLAALAKPFEIDALLALIEEVIRSASLSSSQHTVSNILA